MLEVRDLHVRYGQHRTLEGVSLTVGRGEIVVILGANGAGKSTLLKAVSGICEGTVSGSVSLQGEPLLGLPPHRIVEAGIALVPEGRGVFADLSVVENLLLGAYPERAREEEAANLDRVLSLFPRLSERRRQEVRTMSGGEQQMVAIGRAMMSNPALLTLDEPSLGLSPLLSKELFQTLKSVRDTGIGILLVEQNARASLNIADRGYLLENGRIIHADSAERLRSDPAVQAAYLGAAGHAAGPVTRQPAPPSPRPSAPVREPVGTAPAMPPSAPSVPRPAAGPSPADIAAAAMRSVSAGERKAQPAAAPPERPRPPLPVARPEPTPGIAPPPARPAASAPPVHGMQLDRLVAEAAKASRARFGDAAVPARPRPPAKQSPTVSVADLSAASSDRLKAILGEIEQAAASAREWRPDLRPSKGARDDA